MKKKILLVSILFIGIALVAIGVNKLVFADGSDVNNPDTIVLNSETEAIYYGNTRQEKVGNYYKKLTQNEINQFSQFFEKGDIYNEGADKGYIGLYDAQKALELYTQTVLINGENIRAQTKLELFLGNVIDDEANEEVCAVTASDAQRILNYWTYKVAHGDDKTIDNFDE